MEGGVAARGAATAVDKREERFKMTHTPMKMINDTWKDRIWFTTTPVVEISSARAVTSAINSETDPLLLRFACMRFGTDWTAPTKNLVPSGIFGKRLAK
ncbi:hypothetical protein HDU67_000298 [Dinochytrium kinnereticum]|nr:hypothetical protein HDU67_000298 [Dinochytrium kinnereticum]